jgi:hypothetical protein
MNKNLGGRGKKAPYETTHVRIPVSIKDRVEHLKELYINGWLDQHDKELIENQKLSDEYRNLLTGKVNQQLSDGNKPLSLEDALTQAKHILKSKQSARKSIIKLLTALYGTQISEEDLKD